MDLLDLALSADTVNTVKNLRVIMEMGVEPLALMSQLATVITDILAGTYDFTKERNRRKFFRRLPCKFRILFCFLLRCYFTFSYFDLHDYRWPMQTCDKFCELIILRFPCYGCSF